MLYIYAPQSVLTAISTGPLNETKNCGEGYGATMNQLVPVSGLPGLRSSFTLQLHIQQYRLSTAGRRSFPVAASIVWNTLPDDVQSAPSVSSIPATAKDIPVSPFISGHHSLHFRTTLSWTLQQFRLF